MGPVERDEGAEERPAPTPTPTSPARAPRAGIPTTRRWFLGVLAALAVGGTAVVVALRDDLSRALRRRRSGPSPRPVLTLAESELDDLALLAGLSPDDHRFAAYAKPRLQLGAQEVDGVGDALRTALARVRESAAGADLRTLDGAGRQRVVGPLLAPAKGSGRPRLRKAARLLLRIALNSPQSWARFGYGQYPGVLGDRRAYQSPPPAP